MEQNFNKWRQGLLDFSIDCRAAHPIPHRKSLSITQKKQSEIIAGSLVVQLEYLVPRLKEDMVHIVFTSTSPGLMVAQRINRDMLLHVTSLYPAEYRQWLHLHPDAHYQYHFHLWSHFITRLYIENTLYSLNNNEQYWLHTEGMMCGPKFGRGADHLWKWDGKTPALLKKNYAQWTS